MNVRGLNNINMRPSTVVLDDMMEKYANKITYRVNIPEHLNLKSVGVMPHSYKKMLIQECNYEPINQIMIDKVLRLWKVKQFLLGVTVNSFLFKLNTHYGVKLGRPESFGRVGYV